MLHDQTIMHDLERGEIGNCMQAAIATHLGLPMTEVPHFAAMGDGWGEVFADWCKARRCLWVDLEPEQVPADMPTLLSGKSPRGVQHMVVGRGLTTVHDPHPSRAGIVEVETVWAIVRWPLDASPSPRFYAIAVHEEGHAAADYFAVDSMGMGRCWLGAGPAGRALAEQIGLVDQGRAS